MSCNTSKYACPMCKNPNYQDLGNGNLGCPECGYAWSMPTVFDRITSSPEVLAETLVFTSHFEDCHYRARAWKSVFFLQNRYGTKEEAIAATVAKLKEVCDDTK